jgi:hypothetical protein
MKVHRNGRSFCYLPCIFLLLTISNIWSQTITTIAGGGVGDGGAATQAILVFTSGVFIDGQGHFYIADVPNHHMTFLVGQISSP